jgi:carbamoyltransferase
MQHTKSTGYIAGISRGHNSGVCLLHNGKIVFAIEEERLSRIKYDGSPLAAITLIKQYTDKIDFLVVSHTSPLAGSAPSIEYTNDDIYTGLARKFGLIEQRVYATGEHPQVVDVSSQHHKLHAACSFYRSGFDQAVALVVDGAGASFQFGLNGQQHWCWEVESIIDCKYPFDFTTLYKHYGTKDPIVGGISKLPSAMFGEPNSDHLAVITDTAGITKVYEAVSEYCGFSGIEAGKTMGLFPYGKANSNIPKFFTDDAAVSLSNRNLFIPTYPSSSVVNQRMYSELQTTDTESELSLLQNRRDMAYACQTQTQVQVLKLIRQACQMSGQKKVVISGGYGLNCVANYFYLKELKEEGIEIYVEPISNDGGTAIGAALLQWYQTSASLEKQASTIYLGPEYEYSNEIINQVASTASGTVADVTKGEIVALLRDKNIVCMFQGRSENGPRALGNRSILFDPTFADGKDYVNGIKHREYFRPFAGSILKEHVHDWFDLRGMDESPHMMYAVNCKDGVAEKVPSIIHVDESCRIQTVTAEQNLHFYELISEFYKVSGVPILFNTSFNLGGQPLVETLEDAVHTLVNSRMEYLYLPEYNKLLTFKNKL